MHVLISINTYILRTYVCVFEFMKANNKDNAKASYDANCVFGGITVLLLSW